jgi:hypothetical protein
MITCQSDLFPIKNFCLEEDFRRISSSSLTPIIVVINEISGSKSIEPNKMMVAAKSESDGRFSL